MKERREHGLPSHSKILHFLTSSKRYKKFNGDSGSFFVFLNLPEKKFADVENIQLLPYTEYSGYADFKRLFSRDSNN